MNSKMGNLVPVEAYGLWKRDFIDNCDGTFDRTTQVYWAQTRERYIDLRIPADRPRVDQKGFGDLSREEALRLGEQKGFSGKLSFHGGLYRWHRDIDFRPPTGRTDEGMVDIAGDKLFESGDPTAVLGHAYREEYTRMANGQQLRVSLTLKTSMTGTRGGSDRRSSLLLIDDYFMFARERPHSLPEAESLTDLIEQSESQSEIANLLGCEVSLGDLEGEGGRFRIFLSTMPWLEGKPLFTYSKALVTEGGVVFEHKNDTSYWSIEDANITEVFLQKILQHHAGD